MYLAFNDPNSRISKIWHATIRAAKESPDGNFNRKRIEDLEPRACGNNRQPSKAAFDIFRKSGLIETVGRKGNSEFYKLSGEKPKIQNLDTLFAESSKTQISH